MVTGPQVSAAPSASPEVPAAAAASNMSAQQHQQLLSNITVATLAAVPVLDLPVGNVTLPVGNVTAPVAIPQAQPAVPAAPMNGVPKGTNGTSLLVSLPQPVIPAVAHLPTAKNDTKLPVPEPTMSRAVTLPGSSLNNTNVPTGNTTGTNGTQEEEYIIDSYEIMYDDVFENNAYHFSYDEFFGITTQPPIKSSTKKSQPIKSKKQKSRPTKSAVSKSASTPSANQSNATAQSPQHTKKATSIQNKTVSGNITSTRSAVSVNVSETIAKLNNNSTSPANRQVLSAQPANQNASLISVSQMPQHQVIVSANQLRQIQTLANQNISTPASNQITVTPTKLSS